MSVLIKGMKMPKGCAFCRIKRRNGKKMVCPLCDEEWDIHDPMSAAHRLDNCPLVPVKPHGRLIDADALEHDFREDAEDAWNKEASPISWADAFDELADMVADAPTILEAEEGE